MNKFILVLIAITFATPVFAKNFHGLDSSDDCFESIVELSNGIAQSYKVYNKSPAKIVEISLQSETEIREYSLKVSHKSRVDHYRIELSNDSAYKCLMEKISPIEFGN